MTTLKEILDGHEEETDIILEIMANLINVKDDDARRRIFEQYGSDYAEDGTDVFEKALDYINDQFYEEKRSLEDILAEMN